jgi:hypothetical protein
VSGVVAARLLDPEDDVPSLYWLIRYFRRGCETRATYMGIDDADQKILAGWRYVESADGRTQTFRGRTNESYSDINLMLKTLLRTTGNCDLPS